MLTYIICQSSKKNLGISAKSEKKGPGGAKMNLTKDALIKEMLKKPASDIERVYKKFITDGYDKFIKESEPPRDQSMEPTEAAEAAVPAIPVAPQAEDTAETRARLVKDLVSNKIAAAIDAREGKRQTQKNIEKGRKMAQNFKARLKAVKPKEAPNADAPKAEAPKAGLKAVIKAVLKAAQKKATPPPSPKASQKKATPPPSPKAAETKQTTRGAPPPIPPPGIFPIKQKKFEEDHKEENQLKKITRHNFEKIDDSVKVKPSSTVMPTIEVSDIRRALAKSNIRRFKIGTNVIKYHRLNGIGKTATDFI